MPSNTNRYETLLFSVADHIATVVLNRPDARNAMNAQMCHELISVSQQISETSDIRVVLIKGAGDIFCAGGDLKERKGMSNEDVLARRDLAFDAYASIEQIPQPVVTAIHGAAYGSGLELVAVSDFTLASSQTKFCYPEVGWGSIGATQRLPRIVGPRVAKELLFTSRVFFASEAKEIGLINHIYATDELGANAQLLVKKIAAAAPLAMRLTKYSVNSGLQTTPAGARSIELQAIKENLEGSDWRAATEQFGNKK